MSSEVGSILEWLSGVEVSQVDQEFLNDVRVAETYLRITSDEDYEENVTKVIVVVPPTDKYPTYVQPNEKVKETLKIGQLPALEELTVFGDGEKINGDVLDLRVTTSEVKETDEAFNNNANKEDLIMPGSFSTMHNEYDEVPELSLRKLLVTAAIMGTSFSILYPNFNPIALLGAICWIRLQG